MKFVVVFRILSILAYADAVTVTCNYGSRGGWLIAGLTPYHCNVRHSIKITTKGVIIDNIIPSWKQDVIGFTFRAHANPLHYFPKNVESFFPNLEIIYVHSCHLKEITQENVKPFPKLRELSLSGNDIEVLEEGLFDYNPQIEVIAVNHCKLIQMAPTVFDNLYQLRQLYLDHNKCVYNHLLSASRYAGLSAVISLAKSNCVDPGYAAIDRDLRSLNDSSIQPSTNNFMEKYNQLKNNIAYSNIHYVLVSSLNRKLAAILAVWEENKRKEAENKDTTTPSTTTKADLPETQTAVQTERSLTETTKLDTGLNNTQIDFETSLNEPQTSQAELIARISALEVMTQKMLKMIGNMTVADEVDMSYRCDGEWNN